MIPILYGENETNFTSNGLGRLSDAISCHVIEERNGQFTLEMVYPVSGKHYADIKHSRYIYAVPSDGEEPQPFRIYKTSKPLSGKVTILAEHRSYQLSMIPCEPFTAANVAQALQGLKNHSLETNPFTFWTDKTTVASYKQEAPASVRSRLGGVQGSILDVYGGEFKFDNTTVRLYANRGADRGVVLNYGKNIVDINQEENIEQCVTGCCPYWKDETSMVMLPEKVVYSTNANLYPYHRTEVVDFSSYFQEQPTVAQLRAKAESYINGQGIPKVSIKVSFVALWQTEEYKNIANLERVKLCDTITVYFEKLGIEAQAKVIKTDYNVLKDRYDSIEIGEARSSLTSQVVSLFEEMEDKPSNDWMQQSITRATELITGGLGGYVVLKPNANGKPEEILIMDNEDATQAVNVIRMNLSGIGFSTTGINGPYTTAWTIDGKFNADFITAGTLRAIDINGVNISGSDITGATITGTTISGSTLVSANEEYGFDTTISGGTVAIHESSSSATHPGITVMSPNIALRTELHSTGVLTYDANGDQRISLGLGGIGTNEAELSIRSNDGTASIKPYTITLTEAGNGLPIRNNQLSPRTISISSNYGYYANNTQIGPAMIEVVDDSYRGSVTPSNITVGVPSRPYVVMNAYSSGGSIVVYDSGGTGVAMITSAGAISGTSLSISGYKARISDTKNYGERLLYCYETPTPYFGDLGEGKTDESGKCYIFLDDIFDESIEGRYQVFLQAYGDGRLYVSERTASYFVVEGEPNTAFGWELKAPQKGYSLHRLEPFEHEEENEENTLEETYQYLNQYLYNVEGEVA